MGRATRTQQQATRYSLYNNQVVRLTATFSAIKGPLSKATAQPFLAFNGCSHNPSNHRFLRSRDELHKRSPNLSHIETLSLIQVTEFQEAVPQVHLYTLLGPLLNMADLCDDRRII